MSRFRVAENADNLACKPWSDAIGIELVGVGSCATPPVVAWLTRGNHPDFAGFLVDALNAAHNEGYKRSW